MNRRRKYFIEKKFQSKFIMKFCVIVIISSVLVGLLLFFLSRGSTTVAIENTKVVVKNTADFLLPLILITLILVTAFSALTIGIISLFITHKIVGPLYRLKVDTARLGEGDLTVDFRVRSGDQLKELAWSLTEAVSTWKEKVKCIKKELNEILPQLEKSSVNKEEIRKIKEAMDFFKI